MKNKMTYLMLVFALGVFGVGCNDHNAANDARNSRLHTQPTVINEYLKRGVVEYGNGVYYFPYYGAEFGNALAEFINKNPEMELVVFSGDGSGVYGRDDGQWVVFRKRKKLR